MGESFRFLYSSDGCIFQEIVTGGGGAFRNGTLIFPFRVLTGPVPSKKSQGPALLGTTVANLARLGSGKGRALCERERL